MNDAIREKLKSLPDKPGCYIMRDRRGRIIYVGKAVNLKRRVGSYFRAYTMRRGDPKVRSLVNSAQDIEWIVLRSEDEALLTVVNRAARTVTCSVELAAPGAGLEESERLALLRMGYTRLVPVDGGEPTALENGRAKLKLPPCSAVIYELKK